METLCLSKGPLCYPSRFSNNLSRPPQQPEKPSDDQWTFDENKRFENALTELNLDAPYLFQKLSTRVPGKTVAQVKKHFEALFEDILMIESGRIAVPELFLKGLEQYGKGDWRSISRFCVVTRTTTQVASHAQKYFLRGLIVVKGPREGGGYASMDLPGN
ncbi:hypothetical protein ACE6H2_024948 [Prunus campanulata]